MTSTGAKMNGVDVGPESQLCSNTTVKSDCKVRRRGA